jgi:UDP-N-acetylmuramoylalanine--D-glutamate ligase
VNLRDARVLVVGAGRSGVAAARFLVAKGARVTLTDSEEIREREEVRGLIAEGVQVESGGHTVATFLAQDLLVLSPGVPPDIPPVQAARAAGVPLIPEVELAWNFLAGRIVGVTGSNGKTTTTALIARLLAEAGFEAAVAGNIGIPLISQVGASLPGAVHVVELSSFQLETIDRFRPAIAVVLNVTPDHLDRHKTFDEYARVKGQIFKNQTEDDFAVLNADDETCRRYAERTRARILWFSRHRPVEAGAWVEHNDIVWAAPREPGAPGWEQTVLGLEEIPLKGQHNVENVLAGVCVAAVLGAEAWAIRAGVRAFRAVEHRLEYVATLRGVHFYNDSKATNVDATAKALEAFPGNVLIILGGKDKDSDYGLLRPLLAQKAKGIFLIGEAADKIASHLGLQFPLVRSGTLEAAVREAFRQAQAGDTVLLAPACASFDQFQDYEHRGRVFKDLVRRLEQE